MKRKTAVTVSGINEIDFGITRDTFYWIKNKGNTTIYVSAKSDFSADDDDVAELKPSEITMLENHFGKIYILGSGTAEIVNKSTPECPFKNILRGSENTNDLSVVVDGKRSTNHVDVGWMILENGSAQTNSKCKIDCYDVSSLSQIYIKIDDPECVFNFQNNSNVSSAYPNPNLIGSPVISGKSGFYNVPEGVTWICFGVKNTDTVTGVYNYHVSGVPIVNE